MEAPLFAASTARNAFGFAAWPYEAGFAQVFVDDIEVEKVTAYSIPDGWVEAFELDCGGRVFLSLGQVVRKIVTGSVRVVVVPHAEP